MNLETAREWGKEAGLSDDVEFVNNILLHGVNLFSYGTLAKEIDELRKDAKAHGIKFHKCGMAMKGKKCYFCEKFKRLKK